MKMGIERVLNENFLNMGGVRDARRIHRIMDGLVVLVAFSFWAVDDSNGRGSPCVDQFSMRLRDWEWALQRSGVPDCALFPLDCTGGASG